MKWAHMQMRRYENVADEKYHTWCVLWINGDATTAAATHATYKIDRRQMNANTQM